PVVRHLRGTPRTACARPGRPERRAGRRAAAPARRTFSRRPPLGPAGGGCHGGSGARVEPGGARARTGPARGRRAAVAARGGCRGVRYGRRRAAGKARARSRPRRRASGPARGVALRAHRPLARPGLRLTSSDPNHEETTMARNVLRIAVLLAALAPGLGRARSDVLAAPDGGPPPGVEGG